MCWDRVIKLETATPKSVVVATPFPDVEQGPIEVEPPQVAVAVPA